MGIVEKEGEATNECLGFRLHGSAITTRRENEMEKDMDNHK